MLNLSLRVILSSSGENINRIIQRATYDLRHSWSTRAADCGVTKTVKRHILGHSSSTMTGVYTHSTPASQVAAMELVGAYGDRTSTRSRQTARLRKVGSSN